jgi:hypothetical protein
MEDSKCLHVWGLWADPQPEGPESDKIIRFVKERHPLVIFDSLVAFHEGSEQDSTETRKYMQHFRNLAGNGATVLLIHHTGKGLNTKEYRGSSDIKASVDVNFVLTSKEPRLRRSILKPGKCREGLIPEMQIIYREETGQFEESGQSERKFVEAVVHSQPGINQKAVQEKLKGAVPDHKVIEYLKAAVDENRLRIEKGPCNSWRYFPHSLAA